MLYHYTIYDAETTKRVEGRAAHFDRYTALLMATYAMHAQATSWNFLNGTYGALETFTAPTTVEGLEDYLTETGYTVQMRKLDIDPLQG